MGIALMTASLLDSNVIVDYLNGEADSGFLRRVEDALIGNSVVSVITHIEVLGWRGHTESSRADAETLLENLGTAYLTKAVVKQTIKLRSRYVIKLPDAIIAATALVAGLPLMTRNIVDFKRIHELTVIDPYAG